MTVDFRGEKGTLRICPAGELGHHEAIDLMQICRDRIYADMPAAVILDLNGITFMDSSGIAVVLQTAQACGEAAADFRVANTPRQSMKVLQAAGLTRRIMFVEKG